MTTNPPFVPTVTAGAAHAFLAPSSAARWLVCPGSALMESCYPEAGDKQAADEGTASHWAMAQMFDGWAPELLLQDGKTDYGYILTREMVEGAELIYRDVVDTLADHKARGHVHSSPVVEQRVAIRRVHPSACWGTPDVRAWVNVTATQILLYVWDYKFGHKHVEAFENWQLVAYAAGLLDEARDAGIPEDRITVVLRVVQPRSYHRDGPVREWRVRAVDLGAFVSRLALAADDALQPRPECKPNPDACENCTARHACEALQRTAYRGMDLARQAQANDLTPAALGLEMRYLTDASKLMGARLTGLQAQADALRMQGTNIPHWRGEATTAREKWTAADAEVIVLGEMLGLKLAKDPEPITPTQARDLAKRRGIDPSLIGAYASRPSGAIKLVPDDGSEARKVFGQST